MGLTKSKWARISPGNNVTHSVVVIPDLAGPGKFNAAKITYFSDAETQQVLSNNILHGWHVVRCAVLALYAGSLRSNHDDAVSTTPLLISTSNCDRLPGLVHLGTLRSLRETTSLASTMATLLVPIP